MRKYRLHAVAALIVAPAILFSNPGFSTAPLPAIDADAKPLQQPNCPADGGFGCFGGARPSPVSFCRQFMQMFLRPASRSVTGE